MLTLCNAVAWYDVAAKFTGFNSITGPKTKLKLVPVHVSAMLRIWAWSFWNILGNECEF